VKLGVVLGEFPKLSERFIARELEFLRAEGIDLHVFALRAGQTELFSERPFSALASDVTVLPHWCSLASIKAKLLQPLRSLQMLRLARHLPGSLLADPLRTLGALPRINRAYPLTRELLSHNCDAIWAHWAGAPGQAAMAAAWMSGLPLLLSLHAWDVFANRALVRAQLKTAQLVTVCNRAAWDHLKTLYAADADNVTLLHHGVEVPEEFPAPAAMPTDRPLRVLGLGRFTVKKGFRHLLAAVAQGDFELDLMGEGSLEPALRAAARASTAAHRIRFSPPGNASELRAAFERCDVICAPSVVSPDGDRDGVPNVLLEATIAGLPIIATDAGGLGELVQHDVTGLLVPQADSAAIAAAAQRLHTEPGLAEALVAAARARVRESFDQNRNTRRLAELLRTAVGRSG
jgi:glycosyltransferase involved in cell wall biosynthesis